MRLLLRSVLLSFAAICVVQPAEAKIYACYVPSTLKIVRDINRSDSFPNLRMYRSTLKDNFATRYILGKSTCSLAAARNENEACQLIIVSDKPENNVSVNVSELRKVGGGESLPQVKLNKVDYVPVPDTTKLYPDPLPPMSVINLEQYKAQPVWISVSIPKDAVPGEYKGEVVVKSANQTKRLPLSIKVWNFSLPVAPSCVTACGNGSGDIARGYDITDVAGKKMDYLKEKCYQMLLDHKVSPYDIPVGDLTYPEAKKYLSDPRLTSYRIPFSTDVDYQKRVIDYLLKNNWFKKGYFYNIDEPSNKSAYESIENNASFLKSIEPNYRLVAPFYRTTVEDAKSEFDILPGKANVIWCPESCLLDNQNYWVPDKPADTRARTQIIQRKNAGDSVWWYVCMGPSKPYANFFIWMSAMTHRILFWQQKKENIDGLLYWSAVYWRSGKDYNITWDGLTTGGDFPSGDGMLLYPGNRIGQEDPISSIRLEVIRDGIEDFDYLTLSDKWLGPDVTKSYISRISTDLTHYNEDPEKFEALRRELGDRLERAVVLARKQL